MNQIIYPINNGENLQLPGQCQAFQEARKFYLSRYKYPVNLDNSMGFNWALFINEVHSEHSDVLIASMTRIPEGFFFLNPNPNVKLR